MRGARRARRLQALAQREAETREAERARVARDIHDGPLQDLAALARAPDADPEVVRDRLRDVGADLRSLAADLRPPALDRLGLGPALEDLADRYAPSALAVRVDADGERSPPLGQDAELSVYRVAQEALANAVRHGHARTAWVFLRRSGGAVELVVRDDGVGLPDAVARARPGRLLADGHFGLVGMRERARALGGDLDVGRGPADVGTEVRLRVPVPGREAAP